VAVVLAAALATGGWFYLRSRILYGWFQPFGLPAHAAMFGMPPGERGLLDYLRFPLATFLAPQMLEPALLRSVWGGTYASLVRRAPLLPAGESEAVRRLGTATLLLALIPTAAFIAGLARGARRALRDPAGSPDLPLVLATALSLAGYALYTWRNPWFVVVKGTSLLALCLPFAWYTSAELGRWWQRRAARPLLAGGLAALALCIAAGTTFDALFEKTEVSGLPWQPEAPR
jgi:hypothetical protein